MKILMVDNYDSFTYNLVQVLLSAGAEVDVIRNDQISVRELLDRRPSGIVLSPGPGRPEGAGICLDLIAERPRIPILGVCLGHQVLAQAFGSEVARAPTLMHGKTSEVRHDNGRLFQGVSSPFTATRYHSLEVRRASLSNELQETAWSEDGTLMGIQHRDDPYWGVQFHPESILTVEGPLLLENFLDICRGEHPQEGSSWASISPRS